VIPARDDRDSSTCAWQGGCSSLDAVNRLLTALAVVGTTGCFYTDEINQRPAIAIDGIGDEVYRGDRVELTQTHDDPEGHYVSFTWRAYACTDGEGGADCDTEPFYSDILDHAGFTVPFKRDGGLPVRNVRVVLAAKDELGATAKPMQELVIVTLDRPPGLQLERGGNFVMTPNRAVIVYATVSDIDDGPASLGTPTWEVFSPAQVMAPDLLVDVDLEPEQMPDPKLRTYAKKFTPPITGDWEIRVTATDPLDKATTRSLIFTVAPPPPPCIAQLAPIVPTGGAALPVTEPKLFQVPVVIDDLDVFPAQINKPSDIALGLTPLDVTRFEWWFKGPGAPAHSVVGGATASSFSFDPAGYTPGDIVEIRVQVYDRENTPMNCLPTDPTCSVISQPTCIQRQTWRVEVR
jgi:hypothetical protein